MQTLLNFFIYLFFLLALQCSHNPQHSPQSQDGLPLILRTIAATITPSTKAEQAIIKTISPAPSEAHNKDVIIMPPFLPIFYFAEQQT